MKAAILYGPHDFRIENISAPEISEDQCLLNIKACGVCHSEIHQWDIGGDNLEYPRHIGHEVAGEIIKVGSNVKKFKTGDKVAAWTDGKGYAEQIAVNEIMIEHVSKRISFEFALSEPIACTTNAISKANIQLADTVALAGTGFMGLILLQELKLKGVDKIIAIDIRDEMLKLAEYLGADVTINPATEKLKEKIDSLTNNKGVDVCFEAGGVQPTLDIAGNITRMEGKIVILGYHPGQRIIKDLGYWNWMAFDIINAHFRNLETILNGAERGMKLLNAGKINMAPLITHKFPLEKIEDAFNAAKVKPKGFVKSVILMN